MEKFRDKYIAKASIWQIYDIIVDVEKYPLFVPWCLQVKRVCINGNNNAKIEQKIKKNHEKNIDLENHYRTEQSNIIVSDTTVGFDLFNLSYRSQSICTLPSNGKANIQVYSEDKVFKKLYAEWKLEELNAEFVKEGNNLIINKTIVDFYIEFEFSSSLHKAFATNFFRSACSKMTCAFRMRELDLYGNS